MDTLLSDKDILLKDLKTKYGTSPLVKIEWNIEDVLDSMEHAGIELTKGNFAKFVHEGGIRVLEDRSIETGWDVLASAMACIK